VAPHRALASGPQPEYGEAAMPVQCHCALALSAALLLAGCAGGPSADYPSLDIRDVERVRGTLAPPPGPPPPAPMSPAALSELGDLRAAVAEIHARFLAAAPEAQGTVRAAAGAPVGAERWARAQVALAGLEAIRSEAMVPLADIDRLYVDAATSGGATAEIDAARAEATALLAEEDRLIASLLASLG
jgi:hypothetical protein